MRRGNRAVSTGFLVIAVLLLPVAASAQSVITGVVRDATGGVLPGVTVEGTSPALIEKVRTVVTDSNGQYRIVDLRPGVYTVNFSLPGFTSVRREGVELPADFTLTLNADLRVGALEETITVSGDAPVVDVQTTVRRQVVDREALETLPTGRSLHAVGQLIVGVTMTRPDVGGSAAMQQTYMSVHGLPSSQNTIEVDGLNSAQSLTDGSNPYYWPQAYIQEMVYQTSGIGLDATGGGVRANAIPRDGGNTFSGNVFLSGTDGAWVADNVDSDLRSRGFTVGNRQELAYDTEFAIGGPIVQDKLWFFANPRYYGSHARVSGTYVCPGCYGRATQPISDEVGLDKQFLMPVYGRMTWQMSPRNKLAGYFNWNFKDRDGNMAAGFDPETARQNWNYHTAYASAVKWTSTVTNRLLVEAGYAPNWLTWVNDPLNIYERGSAAWFTTPQKTDINLGTTWNTALQVLNEPVRQNFKGQISYVTGAHSFKTGAIYDFGYHKVFNGVNADLVQRYATGVPNSVVIYNTPRESKDIYRTFSVFAQDSWTTGRLTLNGGLRFEYLNGGYAEQHADAGRFVGARDFPETWDLPKWTTLVPRFGAAYDVFGNAKTALKFSLNRYDTQRLTGFANQYNPLAGTNITSTLSWTDANGDDLAQGELGCQYQTPGCEINFTQRPTSFGVRSLNTPDPDIKRPYTIEMSAGVQHELVPRVSVAGTWLRTTLQNSIYSYNTLITGADYAPVSVVSPLDGTVFTAYNLNRAASGRVANIDTNDPDGGQEYESFEFNVNARLPGGVRLFGGTATERTLAFSCSVPDNPNALLFCDQRDYDIPWRTQFKVNAIYTLPWQDIGVATAIQTYAPAFLPTLAGGGRAGAINWQLTPATRYAANCPGPCTPNALVIPNMTASVLTLPLTPGNTQTLERIKQVDISVNKAFRFGSSQRIQARVDVFNILNQNAVLTARSSSFGTPTYRQPATILDGRTVRVGMQMSF